MNNLRSLPVLSRVPCGSLGAGEPVGALVFVSGQGGYHTYQIPALAIITKAGDDRSWAGPREITAGVKLTNWTWSATGPGSGTQIQNGPHKGRLVVACDHIKADTKHCHSHAIYSDDRGKTFHSVSSHPPR